MKWDILSIAVAYWRQGWKEAEQEGVIALIHVRDVPACIRVVAVKQKTW